MLSFILILNHRIYLCNSHLHILKKLFFFLLILSCYNCKENKVSTVTKNNKTTDIPIYVSSSQGEEWDVLGVKITGKILSDQTNGDYSVIITETPSQGGPPLHVHKNEDELFYILKGNYLFNCGEKKIQAKQGDIIRLLRGVPHSFINTDTIVGISMNTITPGGFEIFFKDISKNSKVNTLTKHKIDSIANNYGVTFVKK